MDKKDSFLNHEPVVLEIIILGHFLSIIGFYNSKEQQLLMTLETGDQAYVPQKSAYANLSDNDKKLIDDHFRVDDSLEAQLNEKISKESNWTDKLKKAIEFIHLKNVAIFWDRKKKRTVLYLDIKIEFGSTFKSKEYDFSLDFISLDLVVGSGKDSITEVELQRKSEIVLLKKQLLGKSKLYDELDAIRKKSQDSAQALKETIKAIDENQQVLQNASASYDNGMKILHSVEESLNEQLDQKSELVETYLSSEDKMKYMMDERLSNQNVYNKSVELIEKDRTNFDLMKTKLQDEMDEIRKLNKDKFEDLFN